jgi:sulfur carrier protein ThiS adenylyltransferase
VLCGDLESEVSPDQPPMAPRVGIVANMEADAVLSILLDGGIGATA